MNASGKIVPQSKLNEWKGLDRIAAIVHELGFVYREQEKDDIGIDGEVEICRARDDAKGRESTGKILKIQSKSGLSFISRNNSETFVSPVREADLRYWAKFDIPVLYVVYHPGDDLLYWRHIQAYLDEDEQAFEPPLAVPFDKASDVFDLSAYDRLFELCDLAADRVSHDAGETLYTNVLPIRQLPAEMWVSPVLPERRSRFHERLSGSTLRIPPYVFRSGTVITLTNPEDTENALRDVVEPGTPEPFDLQDWLSQREENEDDLRALLRSTFHRHLRRLGLHFEKDDRRYFFNDGLDKNTPIKKTWTSLRTGRTQPRMSTERVNTLSHTLNIQR